MTDNYASPSPQRHLHPAPSSASPQGRRSVGSGSYDTARSSSGGDRRVLNSPGGAFTAADSTLVFPSPSHPLPDPDNGDAERSQNRPRDGVTTITTNPSHPTSAENDGPQSRRSHKPRYAGGFLLSGSLMLGGRDSTAGSSRGFLKKEKQSAPDRKGKKPSRAQHQKPTIIDGRNRAYEYDELDLGEANNETLQADAVGGYGDMLEPPASAQDVARGSSQSGPSQPLMFDADSAQIVNMALNLSESRRVAARRNMSSPLPPRLASIPDHAQTGGSLKQHLQQQRRSSRTVSPGHRVVSSQRIPSLPVTLEVEPSYKYHFSACTLARAQKAKEHLELMAQYRRLLEIIPPLDPSSLSRPTMLSSPNSPGNGTAPQPLTDAPVQSLGRPYNPLQYIRNRKVRQRERHTISGESCGFSDVNKVSDWVDDIAKLAATRRGYSSTVAVLPPFPDVEPAEEDGTQPGSLKPAVAIVKPRRPRVDWVTDPADMIADVYWLEQNDHKMLIEDRHWRQIFPQDSRLYAPHTSRQEEKPGLVPDISTTESEDASSLRAPEGQPVKANTAPAAVSEHPEAPLQSARERARSKLHDLKGKHHKHSTSTHGPDFLRRRRGSFDDSSDSDSDARRRRARKGTISAHSEDVLEKQMLELIAKEAREREFEPQTVGTSLSQIKAPPKPPPTPQEVWKKKSGPGSRTHNRKESKLTDISDAEEKGFRFRSKTSSPRVSARQSLDIPGHARVNSVELDSSLPNSPDLRPSRRGSGLIPPIGLDLSPPNSRPSSPARNPFSKVKQKIFRERSRERSGESKVDERDTTEDAVETCEKPVDEVCRKSLDGRRSLDKTRPVSPSPVGKLAGRTTGDSQKSHTRMGSLRTRDEIGGPRGIFKNPRIDAIIRGGVSKVGDLIWRKGQYNQDSDSDTSTDYSDAEEARGRKKDPSASLNGNGNNKRPADASPHSMKHYLDVMPPFTSAPLRGTATPSEFGDGQTGQSPATSPSQRRFDRLKPPRIDVQAVSPAASPPILPLPRSRDSDRSTTGSRSRPASYVEGARKSSTKLNAVLLGMPPPPPPPPPNLVVTKHNRLSMATIQSRAWSVTEMERASSTSSSDVASYLSKKEVARARTLMLSTGIKALEISRRANKTTSCAEADKLHPATCLVQSVGYGQGTTKWGDIASLVPEDKKALAHQRVAQTQIFGLAAQVLSASISASTNAFHRSANAFAHSTIPELTLRITCVRERVNDDLSTQVRAASDDADGLARDLVVGQRMKVRRTNEVMDKMLRRRRRRFRWLRRAGWLAVEWALVGFMWYVWLMVMLVRVVLGTVRTVGRGVRWLLWL